MSQNKIHPTAMISDEVELGSDIEIGPYVIIEGRVRIGNNCKVASHSIIKRIVEIGENNNIFQFSSIGEVPQDLTYKGEDTKVVIGDNNIFREYDIRGKVSEDFSPEVVVLLGRAFGTLVKRSGGREIAISGDIRFTTPDLINYFKEGSLSTGVDIINLGIVPTPVNYYSLFKLDVAASVQITGSHNPPEFNGFKLSMHKKPVFGEQIQVMKKFIDKFNW